MIKHELTGIDKFRLIIAKWTHTFLCGTLVILITACAASYRPVITNPELNQWDGKRWRYKNLYPPTYGYLEESEFDQIEFRQPHEIGTREYSLVTDPRGDIDRSKGYDAADYTVIPNKDLIEHPRHDLQITWIRHATFLIQLGEKYQIIVGISCTSMEISQTAYELQRPKR